MGLILRFGFEFEFCIRVYLSLTLRFEDELWGIYVF